MNPVRSKNLKNSADLRLVNRISSGMKLRLILRPVLCLLALLALLVPSTASAATSPSGAQSISIAPFLKEVKITAAQPTESFSISLTNKSKSTREINLSVLDFGSLDETGGVAFAGDKANSLLKKYGLSKWLHLDREKVAAKPGQTVEVLATIVNDDSLGPGGHYGAIIASVEKAVDKKGNKIGVTQRLSSLIFATKIGGEKYDLSLKGITHDGNLWHGPSQVETRFYNPGNVHAVPRGIVKIISGGTVYSQGVMNKESGLILPETYRQFSVNLNQLKPLPKGLVSTYKLQVDYRYDGLNKFASQSYSIRFISPVLAIFAFILLVAAAIALRFRILQKMTDKYRNKNT